MDISPLRILGPISECSRFVIFENAKRGATVNIEIIRNGDVHKVGTAAADLSSGVVELKQNEEFREGDSVTLSQEFKGVSSLSYSIAIPVLKSVDKFNPPHVFQPLYECSYGINFSGMRPGTKVEVYDGTHLLGESTSLGESAYVHLEDGLPRVVDMIDKNNNKRKLKVIQRVCPKPPPPGGASEWVLDSWLPDIESKGWPPGHKVHAPTIRKETVYACSRSIKIENIEPGLSVTVTWTDSEGSRWISLTPSNKPTAELELPTEPIKDSKVVIVHQAASRCEWKFETNSYDVVPQVKLPKPNLWRINCHTEPHLYSYGIKLGAEIEVEVEYKDDQGNPQKRTAMAAGKDHIIVAPKMDKESTVRIRQGECGMWSDWSDSETIPVSPEASSKPKIEGELFDCQNSIAVSNVYPTNGVLHVISTLQGELAQVPITANVMTISVPSLISIINNKQNEVFIKHDLCNDGETSDRKKIHSLQQLAIGKIETPLFVGATTLIVRDVTAGAFIKIKDKNTGLTITSGYAPTSGNSKGKVNVKFSGFTPLTYLQRINHEVYHCNEHGSSEGVSVGYRPPTLSEVNPIDFYIGPDITFKAVGSNFHLKAKILWEGKEYASSHGTDTTINFTIPAAASNAVKNYEVRVKNEDGQISNPIKVRAVSPPSPPEKSKPYITVEEGLVKDNFKPLIVSGQGFDKEENILVYFNQQPVSDYPNGIAENEIELHGGTIPKRVTADIYGKFGQLEYGVPSVVSARTKVSIMAKGARSGRSNILYVNA